MRQRSLIPSLLAALLVGLWSANAMAQNWDFDVVCPTQQDITSQMLVTLIYENHRCVAVQARTMSSIVGNTDETLGGIGVFGPVVIDERVVPAGTGVLCGCTAGLCDCSGYSCTQDIDCGYCYMSNPNEVSVSVAAPPAIPNSLEDKVATFFFISEAGVSPEIHTEISECFVEVVGP